MKLSVARPELEVTDVRCFHCGRVLFRVDVKALGELARVGAQIHQKCAGCDRINHVPQPRENAARSMT
jgi:phage FluMu protein Com